MRLTRFVAAALLLLLASDLVRAQGRGSATEWPVTRGDAQQTSWIRNDFFISVDALSKPGFELQWKTKLNNQPRQLNSLASGVTVYGVTLFVPMSTITGSSNNVFAIDNDTGYTVWQRHFDAALPASASLACPGGITSAATRIVGLVPAAPAAGRAAGGGGRGYSSIVGAPGEGVPAPPPRGGGAGGRAAAPPAAAAGGAAGQAPAAPPGPPPAPARGAGAPAPAAGAPASAQAGGGGRGAAQGNAGIPGAPNGGGAGGGFGRPSGVVYVMSSDGVLHVLGLPSGKDIQKPAPFLPANARASDLVAVGDTLYTATSQNCGGAPNGVWAINLEDPNKPVTSWKTNAGSVVGSAAFTTAGTLIAAIGNGPPTTGGHRNAIVALDPKTLELKDWFTQATTEFVTSPVIFTEGDREIVAAATKDGRVLLLDAKSLGGANHSTALFTSGPVTGTGGAISSDSLALWQDFAAAPSALATPAPAAAGAPAAPPATTMLPGTRWLLVPVSGRLSSTVSASNGAVTTGAIVAMKVTNAQGTFSLEPGWTSPNIAGAVTPIIVNGVVFTASSGKPLTAGGRGTPAVLHALDGKTGRSLWNSGAMMTSFMPGRNLWAGNSQVYVSTFDGTVYAFGFAMERR